MDFVAYDGDYNMHNDTHSAYQKARERYAGIGVDTEVALTVLSRIPLSLHCWQGDDVGGFETPDSKLSGGGIQVTGNYLGKARTIGELRMDIERVFSLIPGNHRLNLHAIYGEFHGKKVNRDEISIENFAGWMHWGEENKVPLDFNGSFFSHPLAESGFTLSSNDEKIRHFWVEHAKRCREIASEMGRRQGSAAILNTWIPDGHKDYPANRMGYRVNLKKSLDEIFSKSYPNELMKDSVETKLFGIGSEAYVVGSHEFYLSYAMEKSIMPCLDMGHFHPTELIADKISSILLFFPELLLHVSRPMRWDSDHVVILNDDVRLLMQEIICSNRIDDIHIGLDFFDASINRIGAWVLGGRSALKGLLLALLKPWNEIVSREDEGDYYSRLALMELGNTMPFGAVWDYYCETQGVPPEEKLISAVTTYQRDVLSVR